MEKDSTNFAFPPELYVLIFCQVRAIDLFSCELVCKSWRETITDYDTIWRETGVREFDLNFRRNGNVAKQAKKMAIINKNIRSNKCILTVLAAPERQFKPKFVIGHSSFNDKSVVVNWIRKSGSGSGSFDHSAHATIIDLETRIVKTVQPQPDTNIVFYGPHLAQVGWNGYHVTTCSPTKLAQINAKNQVQSGQVLSDSGNTITNESPDSSHLIAFIDVDIVTNDTRKVFDLKIKVYDMKNNVVVCNTVVKELVTREYFYGAKTCIVFNGDEIYCLKTSVDQSKELIAININKPQDHKVISSFTLPENILQNGDNRPTLTGFGHSFAYGLTRRQAWCYNLATSRGASYTCNESTYVLEVKWYCGLLMVFERASVLFLDPYTDSAELPVVATFYFDPIAAPLVRICEDYKVLVSSLYSSVKMFDFLHANDEVELLEMTGDTKEDMKPHRIQAHQLIQKVSQLLDTQDFVSRYIGEGGEYRYGIFITQLDNGPKLPIGMKYLECDPNHNTPYFANNFTVPMPLKKPCKVAVLFYERWDGENWRLSKPDDWSEAVEGLMEDTHRCLVQ